MNPYAIYLNGLNPIAVMRETPEKLRSLVAGLTSEQMDAPLAPGKWSRREVLAHFADCELVFAVRLRQALASPGSTILPFDQDVWASRYSAYTAADALGTFRANRQWNLSLLEGVSATEQANAVQHPERGTLTFAVLVETIAGHDRNHLLRLEQAQQR